MLNYFVSIFVQYLRSLLFDLFETLQAIRSLQRNFVWFQISLLWQPKSKLLSIIEKTKCLLFKQKWCSNSNLKQYSLIVTAGSVKFCRKIGDTLFLLWESKSFVFEQRPIILVWVAIATKFKIKRNSFVHFWQPAKLQRNQTNDSWDIALSFCQCLAGLCLWRHI